MNKPIVIRILSASAIIASSLMASRPDPKFEDSFYLRAGRAPASVNIRMPYSIGTQNAYADSNGSAALGVSTEQMLALRLYRRLTGKAAGLDSPVITKIATIIQQNKSLLPAALEAMNDHDFYNVVLKDMAAEMSTRDETPRAGFNDMVATFIGVVRDDIDARQLLTGNFTYSSNPVGTGFKQDDVNRLQWIYNNSGVYGDLERYDLADPNNMMMVSPQKVLRGDNTVADHPEPAGLLTTMAFQGAHAVAGTNRRLVEFTFREFLCIPMDHWADASVSDSMVGRDVDRFPGGSNAKFEVTCKSCHAMVDSLRPAFAHFDYSGASVQVVGYGFAGGPAPNPTIVGKYNQNNNVYPNGYEVRTDHWINRATTGLNGQYFGWRGETSGDGITAFAKMVSQSQAFSKCMVKRSFKNICRRSPTTDEDGLINSLATNFETGGYKLKALMAQIAIRPECIGDSDL